MVEMKVYQGDCFDIFPKIEDKSIDCVICDLPYGTTKCKWDVLLPFDALWEQYNRVVKENGVVLLFGIEPFSSYIRMSNIADFRYDIYWHKTLCSNFMLAKKQPFFKIETISVFYKKAPTYNPQMREGEPYKVLEKHIEQNGMQQKYNITHKTDIINEGTRYPDNLVEFGSISGKKVHPTQKPIDLLEYLVSTFTNENDTVLDNCMGSGSTGLACKKLSRNFVGIEKDEGYFKAAQERLLK